MIDFDVQLTHPAIRDIREISEDAHSRIIDGIIGLRQDPFPFPPLKKKLKGFAFPSIGCEWPIIGYSIGLTKQPLRSCV